MNGLSLISKIDSLPLDLKQEVIDYVDFLLTKKVKKVKKTQKPRIYGWAKDSIIMSPDFDEPLEEFKEYM